MSPVKLFFSKAFKCKVLNDEFFSRHFLFLNIFSIDLKLFPSKHFNITRSVS